MMQRFYEKLTVILLVVKYLSLLTPKFHFRTHNVPQPVSILRHYATLIPISSISILVLDSQLEVDIRFKFANQNVFVFYKLTCSPCLDRPRLLN